MFWFIKKSNSKNIKWSPNLLPRSEEMIARYKNPDSDFRGPWLLSDLSARNYYAQGIYPITLKSGRVIEGPPAGSYWRVSRERFDALDADNRIWWGESGNNRPGIKRFLSEVKDGVVPQTLWSWKDVGSTRNAKQELSALFSDRGSELFVTPKPTGLLERIIELATTESSIVLDSFAGSGTTAHAVLAANKKDGGHRKFILVECEAYADTLTAERVRRVIKGYPFQGTEREELHREPLTLTGLKKADKLLAHAETFKTLDGDRFDTVKIEVKDGALTVTGEKSVTGHAEGLGGSFTYCTLGPALDVDALLTGQNLPGANALGALAFHTATNTPQPGGVPDLVVDGSRYLGEGGAYHVWLIYQPDLAFLKSRDAALTLSRARALATALPAGDGKRHLVFAAAKFVSQKLLNDEGWPVEFAPLPFALYRLEKG